ncbi:Protein tyrosine phosphatase type IVA 1 [Boothiomyces sp. JEL0866]|nr:Protein tyrosine phosphatase type IVA 1 [Boothiomyces sp. JEL0866]
MKSAKSGIISSPKLPNQPSLVQYKNLNFLIFDTPTATNLDLYTKELQNHNVTDVVRVCEPTYDKQILEKAGITVHDWSFPDGDAPPATVCNNWLDLVEEKFKTKTDTCIGVHCVAGLGRLFDSNSRAPALVALALIENGMAPLDAVIYIRERRRGAINAKQLKFLEGYKKRNKKDKKDLYPSDERVGGIP